MVAADPERRPTADELWRARKRESRRRVAKRNRQWRRRDRAARGVRERT